MSVTTAPTSRVKSIAFLILKILIALLFIVAAGFKLAGVPGAVEAFAKVGLGQWFRYFTAATEITGSVLLLWPGRAVFGGLLLTAVCIGAFFAQLLALHEGITHTIVLGAITAAIAWVERAQLSVFGITLENRVSPR